MCVNALSSVACAKYAVDSLNRYKLDNPNKDDMPVFKFVPDSGLNKQIVILVISTKIESAGNNLLILLS